MFKEDTKVKNNVEVYLKNIEQKLNWLETLVGNITARDLDILNNSIREVRNFIMDEFKMRTSMSIVQVSDMILERTTVNEQLFEDYVEFVRYLQRLNTLANKVPHVGWC